ncbi:MAG: peptide ABC transporter permease [Alphaproteobacteria bacterium CG_4_10_14_0_8_um_filter_53_9]|nr:MAG: peptide ABC transporter permease [Alphaproteobacteria bacterium CG_4_10_14_0_8_um_filter_53_9]
MISFQKTALGFCVLLVALALLAPWIAPFSPTQLHLDAILMPPHADFLLGTDALGRDVLSRLLYGARTSLAVGLIAVGLSTALGVLVGALAALGSKWLDALLMRATDVALCFPTIFLILAIITVLEPSLLNVMIVIGLTSWMGTARMVRAELLSLKSRPFVEAATLAGVPAGVRFVHHLIPHLMPLILTTLALGLAAAILAESALSFLGLGIQPPTPSWGAMLAEGQSVLGVAWWLTLLPGASILLTVLAFTLAAERRV